MIFFTAFCPADFSADLMALLFIDPRQIGIPILS